MTRIREQPKCRLCQETITERLPMCDLSPLDVSIPPDTELCFWCREEVMRFYGTTAISENQFTSWLATRVARAVKLALDNRPYKRCEVGFGDGRCPRLAREISNEIWMCHLHAKQNAAFRHWSNWHLQRVRMLPPGIEIIAPQPEAEYDPTLRRWTKKYAPPVHLGQKGSLNGNAKLNEQNIREIRRRIKSGDTNTSIGHDFGVSHSMISAIRRRKVWTHLPDDENDAEA